jgi:recombinational DNA repair protein (RecF pathway)
MRRKEWLLDIEYRQRETFAYSCEAYACVLARAKTPAARRELAAEYGSTLRLSEERVDPAEVASIVAEAAIARNGWKVILGRCAPTTKPRTALQLAREALAARDPAARDPAARGPAARDRTERG